MAKAKRSPAFHLWTFTIGDDDSWLFRRTLSDPKAALAEGRRLASGTTGAALYESGRFAVDGEEVVGDVLFWWSENSYSVMEGAPAGRGHGWSEDYEQEVLYTSLDTGSVAVKFDVPVPVPTRQPPPVLAMPEHPQYVSVACDDCGCIISKNLSRPYRLKTAVGSSSGTYRSSNSTTVRQGSRSSSISYRHGSSSSSGRTYYRHEQIQLCIPCNDSRVRRDWLVQIGKALAVVVGGYCWIRYNGR